MPEMMLTMCPLPCHAHDWQRGANAVKRSVEVQRERLLLRFAERGGDFDAVFAKFNESWLTSQMGERKPFNPAVRRLLDEQAGAAGAVTECCG
jgi:hypothetical protein